MTDFNRLLQSLGATTDNAARYADPMAAACLKFDISTPKRIAAFAAQTAHESGLFRIVVENLNYSADGLMKTWPSRFNSTNVNAYARQPERIANLVYANRLGNGDEDSGDGWRYKGRGLIQITGKDNYEACGAGLGLPLTASPELLEQPGNAALSAAWFWKSKGLNELADADAFDTITRRINGGTIGASDRRALWAKARAALGI